MRLQLLTPFRTFHVQRLFGSTAWVLAMVVSVSPWETVTQPHCSLSTHGEGGVGLTSGTLSTMPGCTVASPASTSAFAPSSTVAVVPYSDAKEVRLRPPPTSLQTWSMVGMHSAIGKRTWGGRGWLGGW